jgi:phosphohistidine phosphatase
MLRLHLLRHAKSSWDDSTLADAERPLAPRGRKAAKQIAGWAAEHDVRPTVVVCSTALRARQTLQRVLPGLGRPEVSTEDSVYGASTRSLLARVQALPDEVEEAMLVGHNPGMQSLVILLAEPGELRDRAAAKLPTGALATLDADFSGWAEIKAGQMRLVSYVVPRDLK